MMFTITYYEQPLINVLCLKFMSCVGQVWIDYLSIDQQCHMISCKHDAMLSLAYRSLFLDKLTTSILYPLFMCFKDADVAFCCSYLDLITEQTILSQTSNASGTLHIVLLSQRSLTYVPLLQVGSYLW